MSRAVARGRMFPQRFSTDRRYGRLSLKSLALFPLMWVNADDQGRLTGEPEEIKYAACPNIDDITKREIAALLQELQNNDLILCYFVGKVPVIQILDWWKANQKMQWAWPSEYPPPDGWEDHLRYKKSTHKVATLNWPISGENSGETEKSRQVSNKKSSGEDSGENSGERQKRSHASSKKPSGDKVKKTPSKTPLSKNKNLKGGIRGRGRGNSPENSGEKNTSSAGHIQEEDKLLFTLKENFRTRWGKRIPPNYMETQPREPNARELAQLRDLAKELAAAGGCTAETIKQAFDEAATQGRHKQNVSYVRAVLLDWLGIPRK